MFRRLASASTLVLAVAALPGCGDEEGYRFPVNPAGGEVRWKGAPVANALVRFHPVDPATVRIPEGREGPPLALTTDTDRDGRFALSSYYADDGVPAGEYVVTVTPLSGPAGASSAPEGGGEDQAPHPDDLPASAKKKAPAKTFASLYSDPAASPLRAVVKAGEENRFSFDLDAVGGKRPRALASGDSE
jgi:hypothetical protein